MDITKALEYYASNPNDPRKAQFDQRLKSGAFDVQLQTAGLQRTSNGIVKSNLPVVKQGVGLRGQQIFKPKTETGLDIQQALQGMTKAVETGKGRVQESIKEGGIEGLASSVLPGGIQREAFRGALNPDKQTGTETFGQVLGALGSAGSNVAGEALIGTGKALIPQEDEESVSDIAQKAISPIAPKIQELQTQLSELEKTDPRTARNIRGLLGLTEVVTEFVGGQVLKTPAKLATRGIGKVTDIASFVPKKTTQLAGKVGSEVQGALTGTSAQTIQEAFEAGFVGGTKLKNFDTQLRNQASPEKLAENLKNSVDTIYARNQNAYKTGLEAIQDTPVQTNNLASQFAKQLEDA